MKDTAQILKRVEIPDTIDPEAIAARDSLEEAKKRFGYIHPDIDTRSGLTTLAKCLRDAGVKPLSTESVEEYKETMIRKNESSVLVKWVARTNFQSFIGLCFMVFAVSLLLSILSAIGKTTGNCTWMPLIYSISVMAGTIVTILAICKLDDVRETECEWVRHELKGRYPKPIPKFALDTAVEVHQRMEGKGTVTFYIEEFQIGYKVKDPFLIVQHENETVYLEVWDEPGFNQQRKA